MKFSEIVKQASTLLQDKGQVSYRMLKREFDLDDEELEDLKAELIEIDGLALDKDGKMLVWKGEGAMVTGPRIPSSPPLAPASYTPAHLAARIRAEQMARETRGSTDGERKTITALFADIKGSMALMEDLDPEEARHIIDPALQLMMDAVHHYEGYVAQSTGDGIFAFFGAPLAHEDHPQRALFAALQMQDESRRLAERLRVERSLPALQIRVGINTGAVVMRGVRKDDLHTDYTPIGHSTGLASRMEGLATPGSIVVSAQTYKLTEGYFAFKPLGAVRVKGVSEPVLIYEVLGAGPLRTRLQVSAVRRGMTRFIGRQREMEQLQQALARARTGHGQIIGVMGEPGLGKSRLFYEFELLSLSGCLVLEASSVSHGKATAYLPVIDLLKSYFRIEPSDDERMRREKVTGKVLTLERGLEDILPYLFALLGIEEPPSPLQHMDPQMRRKRTLEGLKRLFFRESLQQPLILIFEDLHWIDSETQGFLDVLSESLASARILLLVNYRPEYRQEWGQKTYYTQLRLVPLEKAEAEEFLDALLGPAVGAVRRDRSLKEEPFNDLKQLILEKTQGTPFFMEEIVQDLFEQGVLVGDAMGAVQSLILPKDGGSRLLHIPTTVQSVLAARIDRLAPDEKSLLQQLAVIGREFPLGLVRHVVPLPEEELYSALASLQKKEFLYEQPAFPEVEYAFKHALTQEVAYNSVLVERRKALHDKTAQAIETLYSGSREEHYSDLAHHYTRSGNTEKAIEYLHLAGQQAVQRSANVEAIQHLSAALELLPTLPDIPERAQQELLLHVTLAAPLQATRGFSSPEVQAAYIRARELCEQVGETRQLFLVLFGLRMFHQVRGEILAARELGEQLLSLAQREHDPALLAEAYWAQGSILFDLGEFNAAQTYLKQSLTLYDAQRHHSPVSLHGGIEPRVFGLSEAAWILWYLGYPDQALQKSGTARTLAQELSYPFSLASAWVFAAMLHQLRRERALTQEWAEAAIALVHEQGFAAWLGPGAILQGWARAEQGQSEEGISQIRHGLTTRQTIGAGIFRSNFLALLAEAYGKAGQVQQGLATLAEALTVVDTTEERFYEAELYRLKGELMLKAQADSHKSQGEEAASYFLTAIKVAQKQHAKSWELRASVSLARLWQQQGKKDEAWQMLANIYDWFTEGFDTKDLQEAKALLEELI